MATHETSPYAARLPDDFNYIKLVTRDEDSGRSITVSVKSYHKS